MNKRTFEHWQVIATLLAVYDAIAVNLSYLLALWFRYDGQFSGIPHEYLHAWLHFVPVYTVFCLVVFVLLKLYKSIWRFASYTELVRLAAASGITAVFHAVAISLLICRMPVSYYFAGALIQFMLVAGIRFSYRLVLMLHKKNLRASNADRVMLIGAGSAGQIVLRDILISNTIDANSIMDPELMAAKQGLADLLKYSLIVLSSVPMMFLYPFIQKYFVKGVMIGSVKG